MYVCLHRGSSQRTSLPFVSTRQAIAEGIKMSSSILWVHLDDNQIGDVGAKATGSRGLLLRNLTKFGGFLLMVTLFKFLQNRAVMGDA